jgi:hypothetical protein
VASSCAKERKEKEKENKNNNNNNNNNKKWSKTIRLRLGDLIIRNGAKTISLQTLFGRLNNT